MAILSLGVLLLLGYLFGSVAGKFGLPKILGYLFAGLILNPQLNHIFVIDISEISTPVINFCLAFITFEIGSSFSVKNLKQTGTKYFKLAFYESFGAFLFVFIGIYIISTFFFTSLNFSLPMIVSFSLLLASLAAPTDPSATLAVIHNYNAKGPVTNAVLGAAAFDDIITLILFSLSLSISRSLLGSADLSISHVTYIIVYKIVGAVVSGLIFGYIFNKIVSYFNVKDKKSLIVIFLGFLSLTFGLASYLKFDELFSTLTLGFIIRNFDKEENTIIAITEQELEELFFLFFFAFNAMSFNFLSLKIQITILILIFIILRSAGKYLGMRAGTSLLHMPDVVKKYAYGGLIPQGGIVLGLALMISSEPAFNSFSNLLVGIIMGTTIIHEFMGPVVSKTILKKAGEVNQ